MANPIHLPQSEDLQRALLGHAVKDELIYEQIVSAQEAIGKFAWISPFHTKLWSALGKLRTSLGQHPSEVELKNAPEVLNEEPKVRERLESELKRSVDARLDVAAHGLMQELKTWQEASIMDKKGMELARFYNQGDIAKARETAVQMVFQLESLGDVVTDRFMPSSERFKMERQERIEQSKNILSYGVKFLDEATGGIPQQDVVVLGAPSGRGKTQLITLIARTNAEGVSSGSVIKAPKNVFVFALEAERHEIERRIKFGMLSTLYKFDCKTAGREIERGLLNYRDWRLGALETELGPFEDRVLAHAESRLKTLNTFYRTAGDFNIHDMEKSIVKVARNADLIILDHLHYVDTEGQNENAEFKAIVKKLRDLALVFSVPIIVVAHLRKPQGGPRSTALMPQLADFHGSSDITKIATTGILMDSTPREMVTGENEKSNTWPTFMRVGKLRLDGTTLRYGAVTYFDNTSGRYRDQYALGHFEKNETEWKCSTPDRRPRWAKSGGLIIPNYAPPGKK